MSRPCEDAPKGLLKYARLLHRLDKANYYNEEWQFRFNIISYTPKSLNILVRFDSILEAWMHIILINYSVINIEAKYRVIKINIK